MAKGFFPYPGGKAQVAKRIYERFANHDTYVEPFGGAAGVLFHKPRSEVEVYNDISDEVWNFFDVYSRRTDELVDILEDVYHSKKQYDIWERNRPEDRVERAARFFFMRYSNWGSKLDPSGFRRMKHRSVAKQFRSAVEDLDSRSERLHGVTIENLDYREVVDRYDSDGTLFYFDPPYVEAGDALYDYEGEFDHAEFVGVLDDISGYWMTSYDTLPEAEPESFEYEYYWSTDNQVGNGQYEIKEDRGERLIMNYNPGEVPTFEEAGQSGLTDFD